MSCLAAPDFRFWERSFYEPIVPNLDSRLLSECRDDESGFETSRVLVSERSQRELTLKEERVARVALVKHVIYLLHLARTDHSCLRNGTRILQAYGEGSYFLHEMLGSKEETERCILEGHEEAAWSHLVCEVLPWMIRLAHLLHAQRRALLQGEQEARHDVALEEAAAHQELCFKRSVLRHTECVVTQLTREDNRVSAINEKMQQLGYRSLRTREGSSSHARNRDGGIEVALSPHQPYSREGGDGAAQASPESRVHALSSDSEFLETHIMGLRALRVLEEDKLRNLRVEVRQADELLRLKQSLLQPPSPHAGRRG